MTSSRLTVLIIAALTAALTGCGSGDAPRVPVIPAGDTNSVVSTTDTPVPGDEANVGTVAPRDGAPGTTTQTSVPNQSVRKLADVTPTVTGRAPVGNTTTTSTRRIATVTPKMTPCEYRNPGPRQDPNNPGAVQTPAPPPTVTAVAPPAKCPPYNPWP